MTLGALLDVGSNLDLALRCQATTARKACTVQSLVEFFPVAPFHLPCSTYFLAAISPIPCRLQRHTLDIQQQRIIRSPLLPTEFFCLPFIDRLSIRELKQTRTNPSNGSKCCQRCDHCNCWQTNVVSPLVWTSTSRVLCKITSRLLMLHASHLLVRAC